MLSSFLGLRGEKGFWGRVCLTLSCVTSGEGTLQLSTCMMLVRMGGRVTELSLCGGEAGGQHVQYLAGTSSFSDALLGVLSTSLCHSLHTSLHNTLWASWKRRCDCICQLFLPTSNTLFTGSPTPRSCAAVCL